MWHHHSLENNIFMHAYKWLKFVFHDKISHGRYSFMENTVGEKKNSTSASKTKGKVVTNWGQILKKNQGPGFYTIIFL